MHLISADSTLLIRADAAVQMGTGHVMRCLALAQAWQAQGGKVIFLTHKPTATLTNRLQAEGMEVSFLNLAPGSEADAWETGQRAKQWRVIWVVVDGYHFQSEYQFHLQQAGIRCLFLDDYGHGTPYSADLILNQNAYAQAVLYGDRPPTTQLLLGCRYGLLRREFWPWRGWQRQVLPRATRVLVTLGGSDPNNTTALVIQALQLGPSELEVDVVAGGGNPHYEALQALVQSSSLPIIRLHRNVTQMPKLMAQAEVAIAAGGTTCWELAFLGVPSLLLVLAENQQAVAATLQEQGIAWNLGWHQTVTLEKITASLAALLESLETRRSMAVRGQALVDGSGSERVLMYLEESELRLRPARMEDCPLVWAWANEPGVRAASFSSEAISWEEHVPWFQAQLQDPNCRFYLALDRADRAVGQVRYNLEGEVAVISLSLDSAFRQRGYGGNLIKLASNRLFHQSQVQRIYAYVKPTNEASLKAFAGAGFHSLGLVPVRGTDAVQFVLHRINNHL